MAAWPPYWREKKKISSRGTYALVSYYANSFRMTCMDMVYYTIHRYNIFRGYCTRRSPLFYVDQKWVDIQKRQHLRSPGLANENSVNWRKLQWEGVHQRLYRKDRLPRYFYCYRQLANLRIVRCICLYNALLGPVCYKLTESCFPCYEVLGFCRFWFKIQDFMGWN